MEAVVVIAILIVLGLILGVSVSSVAQLMVGLMILVLGLMLIFFAGMTVVLLFTKRIEGELDSFEKPENGFETAVYRCGDELLHNIFPAENIMRDTIYKPGKRRLRVFRGKKRSFVIDRHSMAIIISGLVLTLPSLAYVITEYLLIRTSSL